MSIAASDPVIAATTPELVTRCAERYGASPALLAEGEVVSYADLEAAVRRVAGALIASGIASGDRVALLAPNSPRWVTACLGVQAAGAIVVPVSTRSKGAELHDVLARSGARVLLTVAGFLDIDYVDMVCGASGPAPPSDLPALEELVLLAGEDGRTTTWSTFCARAAGATSAEVRRRWAAVGPDDVADIMFTSGTSGRPKGVMISHGQMLCVYRQFGQIVGMRPSDRSVVVPPFFHTFGYRAGFIMALLHGAVTLPVEVFDPDAVLTLVAAERVTILPGPPAILKALAAAAHRGEADVSSLRAAFTGGADVDAQLVREARDVLGCEVVLSGYGLTESTGCVTLCRREDDLSTVATTAGRPLDGVEVRLVDEAGAPVSTGSEGEILVRGFNVMVGYWDDPAGTAEAIDPEGWLHTGDIGALDEDRNLRFLERRKEMFIVGGFNAYPAEIERVLSGHPAVAEVAVVGMPNDRLGEVGMAFVVVAPGQWLEPEDLIAWSRERLSNYKVPRRVRVVDELPVSPLGKVRRGALRRMAVAFPTGSGEESRP